MVDGGIDFFNGDADVSVSVVAQNFLMVKMVERCFGRKKNYGLTVTVSSEPWCPHQGSEVTNYSTTDLDVIMLKNSKRTVIFTPPDEDGSHEQERLLDEIANEL